MLFLRWCCGLSIIFTASIITEWAWWRIWHTPHYYLLYKGFIFYPGLSKVFRHLIARPPADRYELDISKKRRLRYKQTSYLPPVVTAQPREVLVLGPNSVSRLEGKTTATQSVLLHFCSEPTHTLLTETVRFFPAPELTADSTEHK